MTTQYENQFNRVPVAVRRATNVCSVVGLLLLLFFTACQDHREVDLFRNRPRPLVSDTRLPA